MDTFRMDGYRPWLERATRVDNDNDWSMHTIDYAGFKRKLRFFSKRRSQLRGMLANSRDDSILASDLDDVMGSPPHLPHGTLDQGTDILFATPRATGKTTTELMNELTEGGSLRTKAHETSQVQYVAFSDDDIEMMDQRRMGGRPPVPLQIETDTSNRSERSSSMFWGPPRVKRQAVLRQVSNFERNDMMIFLALELDKVVMFYLSQWQAISTQILDYQSTVTDLQQRQLGNVSTRMADPVLQQIGTELLELEAFVVINLVTVRQMLIRYDAFVRTLEGTPMLEYYMKIMLNPGVRFFRSDSKDGALTRSFRKLLQHAELEALSEKFVDICSVGRNSELIEKFQRQRNEFSYVLESSERIQAVVSSGHTGSIQDTFLHTLRHYFLLGMMEDRLGYEPTYLISRGASLSREMQIMADWRKGNSHRESQKDVFEDEPEEETSSTLDYQKTFNLVMALLAAFLYCMNYYIVEPSSTMYVNALGGQDALAGALIGMMPMASFLAAIAYSIWTNYSFRQPFLLSCFLMLSGNLIYSYAYEYKSLTMAFLGRFMTGLGGPKCIVRRYMADTTSLSIRTSVNACFGMVVAAGSALGPGCAIMLSQLNFGVTLPRGYQISVNGMTGPGYLMALFWLLFSIALCLDFREPDRSGLEEQKRLELLQNKEDIGEDESRSSSSRVSPHRLESSDSLGSREQCANDDLATLYSGTTSSYDADGWKSENIGSDASCLDKFRRFSHLVTLPVRICLGLLFAKVFVIETLVSSTSTLSKNRYQWQVYEVGILGCVNGLFVIPLSILVGRLSMSYQDRVLMMWLLTIGLMGVLLLIDVTDFFMNESSHYNEDQRFASGPRRYVLGYFTVYMSIQSFEGVIGSALSKLIPTALASGTLNSGLLATLVDTFGRTCGDLFICLCGFLNLRQLINLLFVPGAIILTTCLFIVRKYYDSLAV